MFRESVHQLAKPFGDAHIDAVMAPEARGFILGAAIAYELGAGFIPVRKPDKLPSKTISFAYDLEYGKIR